MAKLRDIHHASRLNVDECRLRIAFEAIRHIGNDRYDSYPFCFLIGASMNAFKLEATALRVLAKPSKVIGQHTLMPLLLKPSKLHWLETHVLFLP